MKPHYRTLALVALAAIAIGSIVACSNVGYTPGPMKHQYVLQIKKGYYLPVKDPKEFENILNAIGPHDSRIRVHRSKEEDRCGPPFSSVSPCTASDDAANGPYAPIGVHVTQHVVTNNEKEFQKVLNSFATPTPSGKHP